jgi:excisionase family DNA binding protein
METVFLSLTKSDFQDLIAETVNACLRRSTPTQPATPTTQRPTGYLTRIEVASRYHVSLPTLNEYTKTGKVQGYRIGRRVLYKASEIEAALSPIKTKRRAEI